MSAFRRSVGLALVATLMGGGLILATPAPVYAAKQKPAMTDDEKKARSKQCSEEADKRGLHGKERHAFRSKCKRGTKT